MSSKKTIRLLYPQWQGGDMTTFFPGPDLQRFNQGYFLGAMITNHIWTKKDESIPTIEVPISKEYKRVERNGILDYDDIYKQSKDAIELIRKENPDRIITIGGECSVSIVPFTYLASKYDDIGIIWIDSHPDVNTPNDPTGYLGYHAMALAMCIGKGDHELLKLMPKQIQPSKSLLVGITQWHGKEQQTTDFGIKYLTRKESTVENVVKWIKEQKLKHVLIHFDLDVLDADEIMLGVECTPGGLKMQECVDIINAVAVNSNIVGITVAEMMPRIPLRVQKMLEQLKV